MRAHSSIAHVFVDSIPEQMDERTLYISIKYKTVIHKCCCGCGFEAVTPLSPARWSLTFDGDTVSLRPSVGNWSFPCKSHYWIDRGKVIWDEEWSDEAIAAARAHQANERKQHFRGSGRPGVKTPSESSSSVWQRLRGWFG